jgi:hypothetical protein
MAGWTKSLLDVPSLALFVAASVPIAAEANDYHITGADHVAHLSSEHYDAVYTTDDGWNVWLTDGSTWTVLSGNEYAHFTDGSKGRLSNDNDEWCGRQATIQAEIELGGEKLTATKVVTLFGKCGALGGMMPLATALGLFALRFPPRRRWPGR